MLRGALLVIAAALAGCGSNATKTLTELPPTSSSRSATAGLTTVTGTTSTPASATSSTPTPATPTTSSTTGAPRKTVQLTAFRNPSANIGCDILDGEARCDIKHRSWAPPPHPRSCPSEVDFGQGLYVGLTGAGRFVCAGDTALDPQAPPLRVGEVSQVGSFACSSATQGITCTNAAGHGFFISDTLYRLF